MEQGRKSLGEIFISGTEREPLPLVAPVLCHCSISSSSFWPVRRALLLLCGRASRSPSCLHPLLWCCSLSANPSNLTSSPLQKTTVAKISRGGNRRFDHFSSKNIKHLMVPDSQMWELYFFLNDIMINWMYLGSGQFVRKKNKKFHDATLSSRKFFTAFYFVAPMIDQLIKKIIGRFIDN